MRPANNIRRRLLLLFFSIAAPFGIAIAQTFDPDPPPASSQHLTTEQALGTALEWAKFGKQPSEEYVVTTAIGVMSVAYPPAGAALAAVWGVFKAFAGGPDPVATALQKLSNRLDVLDKQVNALQAQVAQLRDGQMRLTNEVRLRELLNRRDEVKKLTFLLRQRPTDQKVKEQIVYDVKTLAARYLPDAGPDAALWYWSDQVIATVQPGQLRSGEMLAPEFKLLPTFDYYISTLVLLITAIEYEAGNTRLAVNKYGAELLRHAAFLSVRPPWREFGDAPGTLVEQVMSRNTCYVLPSDKYPTNRTCSSHYICDDIMRRTRTAYPGPSYPVASNNQLCTLPSRLRRNVSAQQYESLWADFQKKPVYGTAAMQSFEQWTSRYRPTPIEDAMEQAYAVGAMTDIADKLTKLAKTGSTQEQFIGSFDYTYWSKQFLYAVKPNGELIWFGHVIGVDKNPPKEPSVAARAASKVNPSAVVADAGPGTGAAPSSLAGARAKEIAKIPSITAKNPSANTGTSAVTGASANRLATEATAKVALAPAPKIIHQIEGPKLVSQGWQSFGQIIPAGQSGFYALSADGSLKWYRHDGFADGTAKWKGPVNPGGPGAVALHAKAALPSSAITSGAAGKVGGAVTAPTGGAGSMTKQPTAAASRVITAAKSDQRVVATAPSGNVTSTAAGKQVVIGSGVNWLSFKKIVAGGDGVLYAIGPDGAVYWYRHQDYTDPQANPKWSGPIQVGSGWQNSIHVFSTGEGVIYAVQSNGDLLWMRHRGYLDGKNVWDAAKKIGNGWAGFKRVFSSDSGRIYALQADGALLWYQHDGYQDGSVRWQGPTQIQADWGGFVHVFARMEGTPRAPVIR